MANMIEQSLLCKVLDAPDLEILHSNGVIEEMQYIPHITSMELKQVDLVALIQLLRSIYRISLAMRKASVRSLEPEMVISL